MTSCEVEFICIGQTKIHHVYLQSKFGIIILELQHKIELSELFQITVRRQELLQVTEILNNSLSM